MGLDNLLAVLLIPMIGAWSDNVDTKLGKRLPFIAVGMPIAALFFILIPYGASISFWTLITIDIIFLLAMTIFRAPVIALMPDHTPTEKRSSANGVINFMGGIGAIISLFGLSLLYDWDRSYPFLAAGLLLLLTFLLLFFTVDRNPPFGGQIASESEEAKISHSFLSDVQHLIKPQYRGQLFILLAIFVYFIGYTGVEALFTVYAVEYLNMKESAAGLTLGFFSLAFLLFAIPAGLMGNKWGKLPLMSIGLILQPLFFLSIPLLPILMTHFPALNEALLLQIILFIGGITWALVNVQAYPLVADLGGKDKIGFFTGLYYLFSMAAAIVAPSILGLMMDLFTHPALFYSSAISFVIAYYLLKKGSRFLQQEDAASRPPSV